jgi:hypothetical protein
MSTPHFVPVAGCVPASQGVFFFGLSFIPVCSLAGGQTARGRICPLRKKEARNDVALKQRLAAMNGENRR